jgi:hypothetical protein
MISTEKSEEEAKNLIIIFKIKFYGCVLSSAWFKNIQIRPG